MSTETLEGAPPPTQAKAEEEEQDHDQEHKADESSQESDEKKDPVTPTSDRPSRERKLVERYSVPSAAKSSYKKSVSIEKGRGTQLRDIPNVAFKLSKRKPDDNLFLLHTILFGKKGKARTLKRNIGRFSGFVWVNNEEKQRAKVKEKLDKCVKEKLIDFCDVLNIPINKAIVRKEDLSVKLLDFLESPHSTTDVLLADKEQKGQKRKRNVTPNKPVVSNEASSIAPEKKETPNAAKKQSNSSQSGDEDDVNDKAESDDSEETAHAGNDALTVSKEENHQENSSSGEEEDAPMPQVSQKSASRRKNMENSESKDRDDVEAAKKATPSKSSKNKSSSSSKKGSSDASTGKSLSKSGGSTSKKQKTVKSDQKDESTSLKMKSAGKKQSNKSSTKGRAKDQGKGKSNKKAKAEPSTEEMHAVVVDILKEVDFNTATLSDILKQLGTHFGVDLMHRKAELKDIITEVINNMTDDEDDGDEGDDNAEADNDDDSGGEGR